MSRRAAVGSVYYVTLERGACMVDNIHMRVWARLPALLCLVVSPCGDKSLSLERRKL